VRDKTERAPAGRVGKDLGSKPVLSKETSRLRALK